MNQLLLYGLSAFLFCAGLLMVIIKRHAIMILLGIELMFNASILHLLTTATAGTELLEGQMFALFVIVVAVCEAAVGMAIILRVSQDYKTSDPNQISDLKEKN
jgi:NADH:ubiquinone oxidoreductase subunit K